MTHCLSYCRYFSSLVNAVNKEADLRGRRKLERANAIQKLLEGFGNAVRCIISSQCLRHRCFVI